MKANLVKLVDFMVLPRTQFFVPVYQRYYDWQEIHCRQLLNDIYAVAKNKELPSHFIGSIVFIQDSVYSSSTKTVLTVIDGQQRLTTITLLLIALAHKSLPNNHRLYDEIIEDYIINKRFDEEKLKLRPIKKDDRALQYLIENDFSKHFDNHSRIIENYKFFKEGIPENEIELVLEGIRKLFFVEISLERGKDDPQRIFESLNSTGKDLSQADLIRNYVLMDIEAEHQERIYKTLWLDIETYTQELHSQQTRLSDFMRDYMTFKFRKIPNKTKIFETFRDSFVFKNVEEKVSELEKLLIEIKEYASYYYKLINDSKESDKEISENLHYINRLEINVVYPFLMEIYKDYGSQNIEKQEFIRILQLIQSFVWRRFIVGLPTNALNKIFMTLYQSAKLKREKYNCNFVESIEISLLEKGGQQRFPNDIQVIEELRIKDFYNIQTKNRIYYLERLENFGKNIPFQIENNEKVTTEHILLQSLSNEWKSALGSDYQLISDKYLHTIANLTISGNNGELGNKSFIQKLNMDNFGYKSSGLWLNQYLCSIDKWTEVELLQRLEIITTRTLSIWKYPQIKIEQVESDDEINVFEIDSATFKKVEYFVFRDTKYEHNYFADILQTVVKYLFEQDAERFLSTDLVDKLKISNTKTKTNRRISPSYYVDTQASANDIIKRLQKTLEAFGLFDELYIKFTT